MSLRNRNPSEPRRSDQPIKRIISQFNGMVSGEPDTKIPSNYCKKNTNVIDRGGYFDIRGGSNKYSSKSFLHEIKFYQYTYHDFDFVDTSYAVGSYWNIGDAFHFSGTNLLGIVGGGSFNVDTTYYAGREGSYSSNTYFTIYPTYADAVAKTNPLYPVYPSGSPSSYRCNIAWDHVFVCDHVKSGKLIVLEGSCVYVTTKAMVTFTKVIVLGSLNCSLISSIIPYGDNAILTSLNGGIFKLILTDTFYYMYRINSASPSVKITDVNYTGALTFGYLYTHTLCRITGTGNRDRTSDGALLQYETGTCREAGNEKDYGEVYFATAVGVDLSNQHVISMSIGHTAYIGMTHIGLYRTKDIGPAGSAPTAEALGNKRDYLIWVADIPLCKPMVVRTDTSGHVKWVSGMKFVRGDIGSTVAVLVEATSAMETCIITGWVSETDVTVSLTSAGVIVVGSLTSSVKSYASIGSWDGVNAGYTPVKASQSGQTVTIAGSVGIGVISNDIFFVSDGTMRTVVSYSNSGLTLVVAESGNFTDLCIAANFVPRNWNDTLPDFPQADGRVSWDDRKEFGTDLYIPRRFFIPLPNCDILHLSNGFMMTAVRDGSQYYYCQTGDKEYTIGHYKYPEQSRRVTGSIQHVIGMGDKVIILMKNKTGIVSLSSSQNIGRTEVGEDIFQLPEISVVDDNKGVIAWKLITFKNANILFALTSDGAFRYFDGSMWSAADLGFVNGFDAVSKEYLKRIDHSAAYGADYNSNGGIKLWAKRIVGGVSEDICLRFSTDSNEGQGWSIIEGTHWVEPMESFGVFTILDDNGVQRCLVIDKNDHFIYEIDTFDRITRERKYVLDKTGVQNAEIPWSKRFREEIVDLGSQNKRLKHQQSYVNVMPEYVEDRGETGYTATGIRDAQELTLKAFEDGEQSTASAQTNDFPEDGELVYSGRRVEASRIATELSGTAGEIRITGMVNEFIAENRGPSADKRINTEAGLEEELNQDLIYHACRANIDRVSGDSLGAGVSFITGPDGRSRSGMTFTGVRSIAITGATHTILLWSKDTNLFTGIAGFTAYGVAVSGWTLYYKKTAIATATIELMAGDKADIRIYDKTLTDAAIADLYADTVTFEGKRHLPGFRMTEDL